jgi:acetyl-CoA carboxylase biotin carboxyl carrier protein
MNIKEIKELIDLITEKGISEFELERNGVRLKVSRSVEPSGARAAAPQAEATRAPETRLAEPAPHGIAAAGSLSSAQAELVARPSLEELYVVRSPMVGTFYSSSDQGASPFVQVGDKIQPGQVLCIIEAMKLMNEIEAEIAGEVIKCYVENGQPVEYGEPLFDLRPAPAKKRS